MTYRMLHMQVPLACSLLLANGAATEAAAAMRLAGHPSAPAQAALARRQPQKCLLTTLMVSTSTIKLHQMVPCLTAPWQMSCETLWAMGFLGPAVSQVHMQPWPQHEMEPCLLQQVPCLWLVCCACSGSRAVSLWLRQGFACQAGLAPGLLENPTGVHALFCCTATRL